MSLQAWFNPQQSGHGLVVHCPDAESLPDQGTWYAWDGNGQPFWLSFGESRPLGDARVYKVFRWQPVARLSPPAPLRFPLPHDGVTPVMPVGELTLLRNAEGALTLTWRIQRWAVGHESSEVLPSPLPPDHDPDYVTGETVMVRLA